MKLGEVRRAEIDDGAERAQRARGAAEIRLHASHARPGFDLQTPGVER